MAVKRIKERSGIIVTERVHCSLSDTPQKEFDKALTQTLQDIGLEQVLKGLEEKAKGILIESGLMTKSGKWKKVSPERLDNMTTREQDAESVILRIESVRECVTKGDAPWAAWNAILAANAAWRAEIRPIEPHVMKHVKVVRGASKGGKETKKRVDARHAEWRKAADNIWKEHPDYSRWKVAGEIAKNIQKEAIADRKQRYYSKKAIYRVIKKFTP